MITILLTQNVFEQDIRELLMAFYPGREFSHREEDAPGSEVVCRGVIPEDGSFVITVSDERGQSGETVFPEWEERVRAKNVIKRALYRILKGRTGRDLPWGSLTGIRPTKIALTLLEDGMTPDGIMDYMAENYYTGPEKRKLCVEVAETERELVQGMDLVHGYSLYLGIPFCPTTCLYCSFTSYPIGKWKKRTGEYLDALSKEISFVADRVDGRPPDTVYMGGGTPTSLEAEDLDRIFSELEARFDMGRVKEITVEAGRPDSISREKLLALRRHGITRISINPQTMKQETLSLIGRLHTVEMVKEKFALARELGFSNINMDLIVGLPGEDIDDVRRTMEEVAKLSPESVTVHSLAIKRAARLNIERDLYRDYRIVNTQEMIDLTRDACREMGLRPYYLYRQKNMAGNFENVGYAKPGTECLYNVLIMEELETIIGCGAGTTTRVIRHDTDRHDRVENVKDVGIYLEKIEEMIDRKRKVL